MRTETKEIRNTEDIIDSRDVIARIDYLEDEKLSVGEEPDALLEWDNTDEAEELKALLALAEEAEGYAADWKHGEALIRDSYFKEYAQELADDIGAVPAGLTWPCTCIDWDQAARELQMDYTQVEFDGVTYWIR